MSSGVSERANERMSAAERTNERSGASEWPITIRVDFIVIRPNVTISETSSQYGEPWIIQMNDDHGPRNTGDRYKVGDACMRLTYDKNMMTPWGKAEPMTFGAMYDVMGTPPVLNEWTAYTSVMEVGSGRMETWLRGCDPPCQPKGAPITMPTPSTYNGAASVTYSFLAQWFIIAYFAHWIL